MNELLILTNSYDATTDVLLDRLREESVFRLNFDQITKYSLRFNRYGFDISDPTGRTMSSETIRKAYWRKPFNAENEEAEIRTKYVDAEMRYVLTEMVNLLWSEQKLVLVEPFAERRTGSFYNFAMRKVFSLFPSTKWSLMRSLVRVRPSSSRCQMSLSQTGCFTRQKCGRMTSTCDIHGSLSSILPPAMM